MTDERGIWVKTEPSLDGKTYVVTVELSGDRAITLSPEGAMRYVSAVLEAAARAEYDAAVFDQMKAQAQPLEVIGQFINDLRQDRPPLMDAALTPLRLTPGVNAQGEPFLALHLDDKQYGQWSVADARQHAFHAAEAVHAADLDAGYFRALIGLVGLDEPVARNVIDDLRKHREDAS